MLKKTKMNNVQPKQYPFLDFAPRKCNSFNTFFFPILQRHKNKAKRFKIMWPLTKNITLYVTRLWHLFLQTATAVTSLEEWTTESLLLFPESIFTKQQHFFFYIKKPNFSSLEERWGGPTNHSEFRNTQIGAATFSYMLDSSAVLGIVSMVKQEILLNNCRIMELENHLVVAMFFDLCELEWEMTWYITDCIVLVTGLLANGVMLWVLLRGKNAFTASQVGAAQLIMLEAGPCRPTSGVPVSPVAVKQREMSHIRPQVHSTETSNHMWILASKVLGLNLAAMNLIYLAVTPVSLIKVTPVNGSGILFILLPLIFFNQVVILTHWSTYCKSLTWKFLSPAWPL